MEKTIVATGKTIDAAVEAALAQLGLDRDSVSVQVLQQAKPGFLGFGAQLAKVQVTYEVPDEPKKEAPKSALGSASRSKQKVNNPAPAPKAEQPKAESKPEPKKEAPKAPKQEAPKQERQSKQPKPEKKAEAVKEVKQPEQPKVYAPVEPGSIEEKIEVFIKGLLENMGSNAVPHAVKGEDNTYHVELVGEDLGYLIGRRGDTLDAIQHLANYSVNRGVDGYIRINVDAEQYRAKREDSLRKYARKKAQQVLKARRRTTLEPMNAYERHVIHSALQEMENITTHSTGTEPNRRVVIEYVR
ncbi:MAG: Jag N-terminal domain-containing protein [Oscillospiraceae bacterium]|nr:Jag N-terminal domain-containing protein [Oscillospiraceae bacterium]